MDISVDRGACRVKVFLTCLNFDSVQGHDFFLLTVKAFIHFFTSWKFVQRAKLT